ncbi:GGDEF domain-containing protein [Marinobacter zhanjiangensis]|uniref:diguanylate cyclase n=1 Tax=Marinobacter zhanjiangensis TaxID=578215 RepID=A0ABQ3B4A7_9GAMM|nr:GGDEF domain-containing protein [Marinobacter zhanjiangensis]GGY72838.1 GGDEF domain-containing protein [Marinobacter zhanjiangensis]
MNSSANNPDMPSVPEDLSYQAIATVLNSLDALVYVADMETHELIFFNDYGSNYWGNPGGRKCWQVLQKDQDGPCSFCTNPQLVDEHGQPTGPVVWEFQNTANQRWYQCRDQAIRWIDGRLVRMEIATDITERKEMEQALEIARDRAEKLAETDELTGLKNRRSFFSLSTQAIHQAIRAGDPIAVIMFDLDHFKQVNDQWGHAAGDTVLRGMAAAARRTVRDSDILARLGGEEFAVLLPATDLPKARYLAQRLQETFSSQLFPVTGGAIRCTASFGIAAGTGPGMVLDHLLRQADGALFRAKEAGRNQVASRY